VEGAARNHSTQSSGLWVLGSGFWGKATESSRTMSINPHAHSRYSWKGKKFVQKSHICSILLSASLQVPCPYPFAICLHGSQSGDPGKKEKKIGISSWIGGFSCLLNINAPGPLPCLFLSPLSCSLDAGKTALFHALSQHFSQHFSTLFHCFSIWTECVIRRSRK